MADTLEFKLIDPIKKGEVWAEDCERELYVVEIYINGREIVDILRKIEKPFADAEGHPTLAGGYGHNTPRYLYEELSKAFMDDLSTENFAAELLCCADCGFSGCWSATVNIHHNNDFVYWYNFKNNHRHWKYDLRFEFDKTEYEKEMEKLKGFAERFNYFIF